MSKKWQKMAILNVLIIFSLVFVLVRTQPASASQVESLPNKQGPVTELKPQVFKTDEPVRFGSLRNVAPLAPQTDADAPKNLIASPITSDRPIPRPNMKAPDLASPSLEFSEPFLPARLPGLSPIQAATSFDGLNALDDQATIGGIYAPPDTDGAVGPNHYVQMVNSIFAIYDKATGAVAAGPFPNNIFWSTGSPTDPCWITNDGDPIVLYDQLDGIWFMSQFGLPNYPNGPFYECIAISDSSNPVTANWTAYTIKISDTKMDDYPHFGIWPDGIYMSMNQFNAGTGSWGGQGVAVFDKADFVAGTAVDWIYFDLYATDPNLGGMLPANLQGTALPAAGTPNYFSLFDDDAWGYSGDQLQVWEFHTDWAVPGNSTFTHATSMPVNPFDSEVCPGYSRDCIPQPGTIQKVDAIGDRLMYLNQYRVVNGHASMVMNHTVKTAADNAAVRWYELRNTGAGWGVYQQGDYIPDSDNRWMGSIASDAVGNIALGYSVSSETTYPSVRFTGRLAGDPLNTMTQGENSIVEGTGSQLGVNRWGDYSALFTDPNDDCTFWYTQEYVKTTAAWNWATRIGSFRLPGCAAAPWGTLSGTVNDGVNPIAGAVVSVTGGATTSTNASGNYSFAGLPAGSYDMTVTKYGFNNGAALAVAVADGLPTTQNFSLVAKPMAAVSGTVTDGSGQGWPLFARINISGYPGSPIFTDPVTGQYSVSLEYGTLHNFGVTALSGGYTAGAAALTPASTPIVQNFALLVDAGLCTAPGYTFNGFKEGFNAAAMPASWTVVDNAGSGLVWDLSSVWGDANTTGGSGNSADANSDAWGQAEFDTELISPVITTASLPTQTLVYKVDYNNYLGLDRLALDIKVDGGAWTNVSLWNTDHRTQTVSVDLTTPLTGSTNFQLRWHYYDLNTGDWDWWAQVDDVQMGSCAPVASVDGLLVGKVTDLAGLPVLGATVSDGGLYSTTISSTMSSGPEVGNAFYFLPAPAGTYSVSASTPSGSTSHSVTVTTGATTRQDFVLSIMLMTSLGDFNGDGLQDIAVFRPSNNTWYIKGQGSYVFGLAGDIPVVGDYNGDGKDDIAVFRPSNNTWYVKGQGSSVFGLAGDIPVVGDYNGDGKDDVAVFRPSNNTWYIKGQGSSVYGLAGDIPVVGDYNGDGKDDIAVFRGSNNTWYIKGQGSYVYGLAGDIPVVSDYNGDGKSDIAVFRGSNNTWYIKGQGFSVFGTSGDIPVAGNYSGSAAAERAVFRPATNTWYIQGVGSYSYGTSGDIPTNPTFLSNDKP